MKYTENLSTFLQKNKKQNDILCPTNPYATTKAGAELIAQSYNHSFKIPIVITSVWTKSVSEKLFQSLLKQLKEGKKVTIQGDGSCVRALLHVHDTVTI